MTVKASYLDEAEGEVETTLSENNLNQRLTSSGISSGKHDAKAVLNRLKFLKAAQHWSKFFLVSLFVNLKHQSHGEMALMLLLCI